MFTILQPPIPRKVQVQLALVRFHLSLLNSILSGVSRLLFFSKNSHSPKKIIVYKIGNIGDITCAIPTFKAVRRTYSDAHITLLTSPGERGGIGARELLSDADYFNEIFVYTLDEIRSWSSRSKLIRRLKNFHADLFIQLPDDTAHFYVLLRNVFFAKMIGASTAFGFVMRSLPWWKKIQVDYLMTNTEVESLLDIVRQFGIQCASPDFSLPVTDNDRVVAQNLLEEKWHTKKPLLLIAISPGCKRETNRWPIDRFADLAFDLHTRYEAGIIVVGGGGDRALAAAIGAKIPEQYFLDATGRCTLLESAALIAQTSLLIANSTGTIHLGAAVGTPSLGFYSVRDVLGRWFPYGRKHRVLYQRFLSCDYRTEECIQSSIEAISLDEARAVCQEMIKDIHCNAREK